MHISILLPVANGAEYLFEALQSVLDQTHTDWNCLVALNGEGLAGPAEAVAAAFGDPRIQILRFPQATNKVAALNLAMREVPSTTDWIALLDADDVWAPNKLATQVATLRGDAVGASVLGTLAHYFGAHQGSPQIPHGWIDPAVLATVNPIINSSALLHRSVAHWEYPPGYDALEDYYLWMRIAQSGKRMYTIPADLVGHRIHPHSAFNARQISPAALQIFWGAKKIPPLPSHNVAIASLQPTSGALLTAAKKNTSTITILTTVCNQPVFLKAQVKALQRYMELPWELVVFNDAKDWPDVTNFGDPTMRQQITDVCRELGLTCVPVPNAHHRQMASASHRHCDTLRHCMSWVRERPGRYWMLDSDMWPVAPIRAEVLEERLQDTFVRQEREVNGTRITYAWPNLWWLDTTQYTREEMEGLCWDLAPGCDTGGASAAWIQAHAIHWLAPHKVSCTWGKAELPTSLSYLLPFLEADPRNQGRFWAELYDDVLLHLRAGSNWNGEGAAIHAEVAALVEKWFCTYISASSHPSWPAK